MRRVFLLIVAAACFAGSYMLHTNNNTGLEVLAATVNDSSPSMPDPDTRIDGATVDGDVLTYDMTLVEIEKQNVDLDAAHARLQAKAIRTYCGISLIQTLLQSGAALHFAYKDKYGDPVLDVAVDAQACSGAG